MPPVNFLIKPASSACNMGCAYCFYRDVADHRTEAFAGMLTSGLLETLVREGLRYAEGFCGFAFQGGEPTLAGLDFYRELVGLQKKYRRPGVEILNAIQTNGYLLSEQWARFFGENRFLVGISLDGPAEIHNRYRLDNRGKGSYSRVLGGLRLLQTHQVEYNILCVLTGHSARNIEKIYRFYRRLGARYLQFIPCLEPLGQERGREDYHLSAEDYSRFLVRIFDLWYEDLRRGTYISMRHLDNWLGILLGRTPEVCSMTGRCVVQYVVEGDGGVYPCDFYVQDPWRLGTLGQDSLKSMGTGETAKRFLAASEPVPDACRACRWFPLCRNGCRREREQSLGGRTVHCAAHRAFFEARYPQMEQACRLIMRMGG